MDCLCQVDVERVIHNASLDAVASKETQRSDKSHQAHERLSASSKTRIVVSVPVAWLADMRHEKH